MFKSFSLFISLFMVANAINGRCRALVLGGGTDHGAFQAGAVAGLVSSLPDGEATWDVVKGVGVGALNGFLVSQNAIGNEAALYDKLFDFWSRFDRHMIYKSWFGGKMVGFYKKTGMYNNEPLQKTINGMFSGSFNRFLSVGVTDLHSAQYYVVNTTLSTELVLAAVKASINDMGDFPVTEYTSAKSGKKYQFLSGDLVFPVDIATAINDCKKMGYSNMYIDVDIIMVNKDSLPDFDPNGKNTLELVKRYFQITQFHAVFERTLNSEGDYPGVNFRTQISLPDSISVKSNTRIPYFYTPGQSKERFLIGYKTAGGVSQ
jgi:hypothetical protein